MKRLITIIVTLIGTLACLWIFTGCDPPRRRVNVDELLANTIKIELVYYENAHPTKIENLDGEMKPIFDFNKVIPMATLDDSKNEDLIKYLGGYSLSFWNRTWNEPIGKTLIFYQSNGNMLVLYGGVYEDEKGDTYYPSGCIMFDKDGKYIEYIGDFGYLDIEALISIHFMTKPESGASS